jgi:hypothetical protein
VRVANRICTTSAAWWQACQAPTTSASATSRRWRATKRTPARRSAQNFAIGEPAPLGRASGSRIGTPRRIAAEKRPAHGVDEQRQRRADDLDQRPGQPRAEDLGARAGERVLGVRLDQPLARHDLRQHDLRRAAGDGVDRADHEADDVQPVDRQPPAHQASGTLATARPIAHSPAM